MVNKDSYTLDEAKARLEVYCAYQERCHKEVTDKLREMRMIPEAIDVIVVHLIENNYLNEERFVNAFVRGKFRIKKWGKRRLILELKRKDIQMNLIQLAINNLSDQEYRDTLDELARKKTESIGGLNTNKNKKKLIDYLLYRGWESHLVYDKVNQLIKNQ